MPFGKGDFQTAVGLRTIRLNDFSVSRSAVLAALDRIWISGSGNLPVARRPMAERRIRPGFLPGFSSTGSVWMPRGRFDPYAYRSPPDTRAMWGFHRSVQPDAAREASPMKETGKPSPSAIARYPSCRFPTMTEHRNPSGSWSVRVPESRSPQRRRFHPRCPQGLRPCSYNTRVMTRFNSTRYPEPPPGFSHTRDSMEREARSCWQR